MNRRQFLSSASCFALAPGLAGHAFTSLTSAGSVPASAPTFPTALAGLLRHSSVSEIEPDLARFRSKGYTGIWIENDYVRWTTKPDPDEGFDGCWRLFNLFDFTFGSVRDQYISYLNDLSGACERYQLEIWASFWIPLPNAELLQYLRDSRPAAIGHATADGEIVPTLCTCVGSDGSKFLAEMVARFLHTFPQVRGLKIATGDNGSVICDETCPNARGTSQAHHAGNLFGVIDETLRQQDNPGRLMLYPWYWGPGFKEEILAKLQGNYVVMTKMEQNSLQPLPPPTQADPLFDDSIVSERMGPDFQEWLHRIGPERVIDMVPTGSGVDDMFFNFPPYPGRLFRRFRMLRTANVARFLDYECGGHHAGSNEEVVAVFSEHPDISELQALSLVAERLYRTPTARPHAIEGWRRFDAGFGKLPIGLGHTGALQFTGRFGFAWPMCLATPLLPELISTKDRWHEIFWFSPYNFFTPGNAAVLKSAFASVLTEWQASLEALSRAHREEHSVASDRELTAVRAHVLGARSVLNWCAAAALPSQGHLERSRALQASELALVRNFQSLRQKFPWIWANNCWHPFQTPLHQKFVGFRHDDADPFVAKTRILSEKLQS